MLVLSRKCKQSIAIGEDVFVRILRIKGNQVTLGIEAPESIVVLRTEMLFDLDGAPTDLHSTQLKTNDFMRLAK